MDTFDVLDVNAAKLVGSYRVPCWQVVDDFGDLLTSDYFACFDLPARRVGNIVVSFNTLYAAYHASMAN